MTKTAATTLERVTIIKPWKNNSMQWKVLKVMLLSGWLLICCISMNHLFSILPQLSNFSTAFLGMLGWFVALLAVLFFGKGSIRPLLAIIALFFLLGYLIGPFLEPPADPLEHLRRIHEWTCGKTVEELPQSNRGLWQYSMAGTVLCVGEGKPVVPATMLRRINIVNGMFWALGSSVLFILGTQAGLPARWAFLSVVTCFLFFGTNRFNYFRYYSLTPSFTSLCIYWLWIALFFFRKKARDIINGLGIAVSALPVVWVNHNQETVFLTFVVSLWLGIICFEQRKILIPIRSWKSTPTLLSGLFSVRFLFCCSLFIIFWLLPQSTSFLHWLAQFFSRGQWPHYQSLYVNWHGLYIGGKIAGFRIMDTLGGISIMSVVLAMPYFYFGFSNQETGKRVRLFVLAILPFIVYFTPLLHFVWSSNVRASEYYRFCYASVFWLFLSDFLFGIEARICTAFSDASTLLRRK
jgi:hypothetical protein